MNIIVLSNQQFLIEEMKKIDKYTIFYASSIEDVFDILTQHTITIFIHHLDYDEHFEKITNLLNDSYPTLKKIALRNTPNNIEGCSVLKMAYQGYMHSLSNQQILQDAIDTVSQNKVWVYPELMQFLISSIPLTQTKELKLLEQLSTKELEVLELVAQGHNNKKISTILDIAEVTVKKHISSLFKKLNQKDRLSLALFFKNNMK